MEEYENYTELEKLKMNYDVTEHVEEPVTIPKMPESGLILIVGTSGSGKSTIVRNWFEESCVRFDSRAVIENFSSLKKGEALLKAVGLRSIPTWFRPFNTLSNGEQHRATCALSLDRGVKYLDEFTSVVDRDTAKSLSASLRRYHSGGLLVVATCHRDVEEWLCPDIIYDTDLRKFVPRRFLRRPSIELVITSGSFEDWICFKKHHYLSSEVSKSCHFYVAFWGEKMVAFDAIIHRCNRDIPTYWGESRIVVLPEFQGLGIGTALSEAVAEEYVSRGLRFFAKTSHPSLGEFRNKSGRWRPTSTNGMKRTSYLTKDGNVRQQAGFGKSEKEIMRDWKRVCYSHEFIG